MSEFSDQVRAGDEQLATLASPDVRLHLPRHTAVASWTTAGRTRAAVHRDDAAAAARPRPDRMARRRAACARRPRAARPGAAARGDRRAVTPDRVAVAPAGRDAGRGIAAAAAGELRRATRSRPRSPAEAAERGAPVARPAPCARRPRAAGVARRGARCALSSQIHRRVNPERSLTATQRQLKRLADRGLIARFQLYRDDGGGVPLCCAVTEHAIELLGLTGRHAPRLDPTALEGLRADVHLVGWLLALEARAGDAIVEVLGPGSRGDRPGSGRPGCPRAGSGIAGARLPRQPARRLTDTGPAFRRRAPGRGRRPAGRRPTGGRSR